MDDYHRRCGTYLGVLGAWPRQSARARRLLRATSCALWLTALAACARACSRGWREARELRHHVRRLPLWLPSLILRARCLVKFSCLVLKERQLSHLLRLVGQDLGSCAGENLGVLRRYARQAARANKVHACCLLLVTCVFNAWPPARPDLRGFALDVLGTAVVLGFDAFVLDCAQHACALFRIVAREMSFLRQRHNGKSASLLREQIARIVELHKRAIHFVDVLESTYAAQQLLVTGLALAAITLAEFEIATNWPHRDVSFRFVVYGAGELLHELFHNYPGQRIKDHSLMIYQSCYDSEWYREDVPMECRKLLSLMMLRSQKSCCLTAGGLYILGLENYVAILKASLTYFTFLSSMQ